MRGLELAQKLCLILWLQIIVVDTPENWGNLGLVNTDGMTIPSYSQLIYRKLIINFLKLIKLN